MWSWIRRNWWVLPVTIGLIILFVITAGRSGSPFERLHKLRTKLDKEHEDKLKEIDRDHKDAVEDIQNSHQSDIKELEDAHRKEVDRLSDPANIDELVDKLRKRSEP